MYNMLQVFRKYVCDNNSGGGWMMTSENNSTTKGSVDDDGIIDSRSKIKHNVFFVVFIVLFVIFDIFLINKIVEYNMLWHESVVEVRDDFYRFNYIPGEVINIGEDEVDMDL